MGGRNMLDSVLIANEVVHDAQRRNSPTLVFKVDYEKAYNSIKWSFLTYVLRRMNFDAKWIWWIRGFLSSSTLSVLVNGSPTEEFKMEKGQRQGDPIAHFFFLIVVEGLNGLLKRALSLGSYSWYNLGSQNPLPISLLQFADDTLFFGEASIRNAVTLKCILRCFELVSGLKVYFSKSRFVGIAMEEELMRQVVAILHCRTSKPPFVYLGLPIGGNLRSIGFWDPIVMKIQQRLSRRKQKSLFWGKALPH